MCFVRMVDALDNILQTVVELLLLLLHYLGQPLGMVTIPCHTPSPPVPVGERNAVHHVIDLLDGVGVGGQSTDLKHDHPSKQHSEKGQHFLTVE